jgi:hypothetical protein
VGSISRKKTKPFGKAEPAQAPAGSMIVIKVRPAQINMLNTLTGRLRAPGLL